MDIPDNIDGSKRSLLEVLFGSDVTNDLFNDNSLLRALDLKIEQERTKQQYYKLERINQSIQLLNLAKDSGISSGNILKLFDDNSNNDTAKDILDKKGDGLLAPIKCTPKNKDYLNSSTVKNRYTFSKISPINTAVSPKMVVMSAANLHQRTTSPARIGAEAVAILNESSVMTEGRTIDKQFTLPSIRSSLLVSTLEPKLTNTEAPKLTKKSLEIHNKKRKRSNSVPSFGVIDLNVMEIVQKQRQKNTKRRHSSTINDCNDNDDDNTCSENSSGEVTPKI